MAVQDPVLIASHGLMKQSLENLLFRGCGGRHAGRKVPLHPQEPLLSCWGQPLQGAAIEGCGKSQVMTGPGVASGRRGFSGQPRGL